MMMDALRTLRIAVAASVVGAYVGGLAYAGPERGRGEGAKKGEKQTTCPVMGGKVNPKLYVDTNGRRIYVCCKGCIAAVKKAPAKYIKKLEDQGVSVARLQATCPVMGGKINRKLYADVDGKRIYVCCQGCIAAIKKHPDKYVSKLAKQGVVLDRVAEGGR